MAEAEYQNVAYGEHPKDVLDLYRASGSEATPLFVYIHGGGFSGGDKNKLPTTLLDGCLAAGISVATINYPLSDTDPYPAAMVHSRRAIQFLRHKADDWGLDPDRVAAGGNSAGAGISLWIGFRRDAADLQNDDPVLRQSSRLSCMAVWQAQCSYDPNFIRTIISGPAYANPALQKLFRVEPKEFDQPWARERFADASAINFLTAEAPPVFVWYRTPNMPMSPEPNSNQGIHHPKFGIVLKEKMDALGATCVIRFREDLAELTNEDAEERFHREAAAFVAKYV